MYYANRHTKMLVYRHDSFSAAPVDLQRAAAYNKHHDTCNHLRPKFIGVIILGERASECSHFMGKKR